MEYARIGKFRLNSIYNVIEGELPIKDGLAIEKINSVEGKETCHVVCFLKYYPKEPSVMIEDHTLRILEIDSTDWDTFKRLLQCGEMMIMVANEEENE